MEKEADIAMSLKDKLKGEWNENPLKNNKSDLMDRGKKKSHLWREKRSVLASPSFVFPFPNFIVFVFFFPNASVALTQEITGSP